MSSKGNCRVQSADIQSLSKYDTNVQILKSFAKEYKTDKVYVANGETLVDALAGVPLAAAAGAPFVLVNQQFENATQDFVKLTMSSTEMVALGGEAVGSFCRDERLNLYRFLCHRQRHCRFNGRQ